VWRTALCSILRFVASRNELNNLVQLNLQRWRAMGEEMEAESGGNWRIYKVSSLQRWSRSDNYGYHWFQWLWRRSSSAWWRCHLDPWLDTTLILVNPFVTWSETKGHNENLDRIKISWRPAKYRCAPAPAQRRHSAHGHANEATHNMHAMIAAGRLWRTVSLVFWGAMRCAFTCTYMRI
jgi:hypothetical protein